MKKKFNLVIKIGRTFDSDNIHEDFNNDYGKLKDVNIIIDLTNTEYVSALGIGYIQDAYINIDIKGNEVVLVGLKKDTDVFQVLNLVGILSLMKYFNTIDEAKKYLNNK